MAYGDLKCNNLIYDTGSGDATVQVSTIPDATDMAAKANLSGANFTGDFVVDTDVLKADTTNDSVGIGNASLSGGQRLFIKGRSGYDDVIRVDGNGTNISPRINFYSTGSGKSKINAANSDLELQHTGLTKLSVQSTGINVAGQIDIDGSYQQAFDVITPATSPAIDCSLGNYFTLDLSSTNVSGTWTFTNVPTTKSFAIAIEITTGASTTVAWNSVSVNGGGGANTIKWAGGAAPTLGASKPSVVILTTDDTGASWYGSSLVDFATV